MTAHVPPPPAAAELLPRGDNVDWAERLDRSRQSWERICDWQAAIIADQTAKIIDLHRQVTIYRKLIGDFERQKQEAQCGA